MVYNRHNHPDARIIDLATGRVLWGALSANTLTGEVVYLIGGWEETHGEINMYEPYNDGVSSGLRRRRITRIIPFDVVDGASGNVIDKCRP